MCEDLTSLAKTEKLDPGSNLYKQSHEAVARYSLIQSPGIRQPDRTVSTGHAWSDGVTLRDAMNAQQGSRFGRPVFFLQLENDEEARAAVSVARNNH